jgi:hypothetical protein
VSKNFDERNKIELPMLPWPTQPAAEIWTSAVPRFVFDGTEKIWKAGDAIMTEAAAKSLVPGILNVVSRKSRVGNALELELKQTPLQYDFTRLKDAMQQIGANFSINGKKVRVDEKIDQIKLLEKGNCHRYLTRPALYIIAVKVHGSLAVKSKPKSLIEIFSGSSKRRIFRFQFSHACFPLSRRRNYGDFMEDVKIGLKSTKSGGDDSLTKATTASATAIEKSKR